MLLLSNGFTVGAQNLYQILTLPLQMLFEHQNFQVFGIIITFKGKR